MTGGKRDLQADLGIYGKVTPGPWEIDKIDSFNGSGKSEIFYIIKSEHACNKDKIVADMILHGADANFIIAAREGWPEAISRAIAAEAEVERLKNTMSSFKLKLDRLRKLRKLKVDYDEYKLQAEVERLQKALTEISNWREECGKEADSLGAGYMTFSDVEEWDNLERFAREALNDANS